MYRDFYMNNSDQIMEKRLKERADRLSEELLSDNPPSEANVSLTVIREIVRVLEYSLENSQLLAGHMALLRKVSDQVEYELQCKEIQQILEEIKDL